MIENDNQLAQLSHLDTMLAQATNIDQITDVRDKARAMQVYAQNIKASKEETISIATVRIKAERKAGIELGKMDLNKGDLLRGQVTQPRDNTPTLDDMNISKYNSMKWQDMSWIPDDIFAEELNQCIEYLKEPTTEYYSNLGKRYKPRKPRAPREDSPINIEILHGDMIDLLPSIEQGSIDLVIADPPYNVTNWEWDKIGSSNEFLQLTDIWANVINLTLKDEYNLFWFCSPSYAVLIEPQLSAYFSIQSRIVWHRRNMSMGSDSKYKFIDTWEMIYHCGNRTLNWDDNWDDSRFDVQTFAVPQTNFTDKKYHPTQKPIGLIERLVKYSSYPGDIVLDPFAGSGTTGEACQKIGRDCILIEKEQEYIDVINKRLFE